MFIQGVILLRGEIRCRPLFGLKVSSLISFGPSTAQDSSMGVFIEREGWGGRWAAESLFHILKHCFCFIIVFFLQNSNNCSETLNGMDYLK